MGQGEVARALWFVAPYRVEIRPQPLPLPGPGEVRVRVVRSAISAGTEKVAYRGLWPQEGLLDDALPALRRPARYPFPYGYACVGRVEALGPGVDEAWLGRRVFVFHPHQSALVVPVHALLPIPPEVSDEDALFYPNMETAITLVHDAAPLLGERGVVFGLGVVGLLTLALLTAFPLEETVGVDPLPNRREAARGLGPTQVVHPQALQDRAPFADFSLELSGTEQGLQQALLVTRFHGRVVVGSWYGAQTLRLTLGRHVHRSRLRVVFSQVSTLAPELTGRWDRERRGQLAWRWLPRVRPSRWITHRFPLEQAPQAYHLLDRHPERCLQIVFTYDERAETW